MGIRSVTKAAELDYKSFWKQLCQQSGKNFNICSKIVVGDSNFEAGDVSNGFREYFTHVFDNLMQ